MLVAYMETCVTNFIFKKICSKNGSKIKIFEFIKRFDLNLTYSKSLCICYISVQNAFGQSDCMIFKSNTSLEQSDDFFSILIYKFMKIKNWLKNTAVSEVKNGCGHFGPRILKLAVSQDEINEIHWLFAWWYTFRKAKSYYHNYWVELIEKGTLKSAIFNEWIDELSWLFASWCKLW